MRKNLTHFDDYREIIALLAREKGISYKSIAANTYIHSSYFSRVMTGKADFSKEQLFLIAQSLELSGWEQDYFLLLGDFWSSGNQAHKKYVWNKIENIKEKKQKIINQIDEVYTGLSPEDKAIYYQEPTTAKVHLYLTIEKYLENPTLICKKIMISELKLQSELRKLEDLKIIFRENGKIKLLESRLHLDESDPLTPFFHMNWRLEAIQHITKREKRPSDYNFSVLFSTDEEGKIKVKKLFKEFVVKVQKETANCKGNPEVYYMNFDLH